jgi:hypothetical protein
MVRMTIESLQTLTLPSGTRATASSPLAARRPDETYIAGLETIDPDIVHGKPDKAVSRGSDQCSSVAE